MKKLFLFICTCLLFTACIKDKYVVIGKECIHHTFSSDNYYLILKREDGKKVTNHTTESQYVLYNIGDTIELYR